MKRLLKMSEIALLVLLLPAKYLIGVTGTVTLSASPKAEVNQYSSLILNCSTSSSGSYVTWFLNSKTISVLEAKTGCKPFGENPPAAYSYTCSATTSTLTIPNVTADRTGEKWKCSILIGSLYRDSNVVTITVQVQVTTVQLLRNGGSIAEEKLLTLLNGRAETFTCRTGLSIPAPTIVWYLNGDILKSSKEGTYTLNAKSSDHGKYFFCQAYNIQPENEAAVSQKPMLYIQVPITSVDLKENNITVTNSPLVVTVAKSVSFSCMPGFGRPSEATIDWYIGSTEVLKNNSLYTYNPKNDDHHLKIYCQAYNIQQGPKVNSTSPNLFVQVKVTSVRVSQNNNLITKENLTVTARTPFKLTCLPEPGYSRPLPTVLWYIDNSPSPMNIWNGSEMSYTPTNENHDQIVYCKAYNLQSLQEAATSERLRLYVRVESGAPTILSNTTNLLDGDYYAIQCKSPPTRPPANVTLQLPTKNLPLINTSESSGDDGLIVVTRTVSYIASKSDNNKEIICESAVLNQNDLPETKQTVTVWWQPAKPVITPKPTFPWLEGQTGILSCTSNDTGNPPSNVNWSSTYGRVDTQMQLGFSSLGPKHDGQLVKCQLENQFTSSKRKTIETDGTLEVEYKPIVTVQCGNKTVYSFIAEEGQSKECLCSAKGNPQPVVNWFDAFSRSSGGRLFFFQINRTQTGNYTCETTATSTAHPNYNFTAEWTLNVTVYYPPDVSISADGTNVENQTLILTCMPKGLPQQYNYREWKQTLSGVPIRSNDYLKPERVISIPALQLQDSGIYTCVVDNGIMDKDSNLYQVGTKEISVKVSPKFFLDEPLFTGKPMENITLSIPFYAYPKYNSVSVMPDNSVENLNSSKYVKVIVETVITTTFYGSSVVLSGHSCNLTIIGLEEKDFMDYRVLISNEVGSQQMSFTVQSESIPLPPSNFRLVTVKGNTAFFSWVSGFNGGQKQTFLLQLSDGGGNIWYNGTIIDEFDEYNHLGSNFYRANISHLKPGSYSVQLVAVNSIGQTSPLLLESTFVISPAGTETASFPLGPAVGGGSGAGCIIILAAVLIIVWKRKSATKKDDFKQSILSPKRHLASEKKDDKTEVNVNPVYESADEIPMPPTSDIYAQVDKKPKSSAQDFSADVYSQVQKPKVEISSKKETKMKKQKDQKKQKNTKQTKLNEGLVYENSEILNGGKKSSEDLYENPACSNGDEKKQPKRTRNEDGLIYIDVELPKQTPPSKQKPVIHGEEDRTIYVDIAYGKVGEQQPEKEGESQ